MDQTDKVSGIEALLRQARKLAAFARWFMHMALAAGVPCEAGKEGSGRDGNAVRHESVGSLTQNVAA